MTMKAYKFYTITGDTAFMSAENIFVRGNISDPFCWIIIHNYTMDSEADFINDGVFIKNCSKPFSNKVFAKVVDVQFNGNCASLKVHGTGLDYLLVDSFGNDLCKLPQSERVWLDKPDKWKRQYLMSVYAEFGFAKPKTKEIVIEGNKIFNELDFCCEVGFAINNQWGFIASKALDFYAFLEQLSDDVTFIWKDYDLSQERLDISSYLGSSLIFNLEADISQKHKIIYC